MNNKKCSHALLALLCVSALTACDGISGTGGPSRSNDDGTQKQTPEQGQAILGPIVDATVTIRDVEATEIVVCSSTTQDNDNLLEAGRVRFDEPCVYEDHLYLVTVSGGRDIDVDDDGARDATPTPNTGEFRALLSGTQLLQNNWKTNALTEAAYQAVQYALTQGSINIVEALDDVALQMLRQDLNGDGVINRLDIARWHPVDNVAAAINLDKLRDTTQLIHSNRNRTIGSIPVADALAAHIDTLAPARQVLTHGERVLVTTDSALLAYSNNNSSWELGASLALGWVYDMAISGDTLYAALGDNGIAAINISGNSLNVTKRWPIATRRIATLDQHIVFSFRNANGGLELREIDAEGSRLIADSAYEYADLVRSYASDEAARNGLLKTLGNAIYWSPGNNVRRFTYEGDTWVERALTNESSISFNIIDDIEIRDDTVYVVARKVEENISLYLELASKPTPQIFDIAMQKFVYRRTVTIFDISDITNPEIVDTLQDEDIAAIRYWNNTVIALGAQHISVRNVVDLASDAQFALPGSFRGFDPVHGLAQLGDLVVVAARENGVLFLTPPPVGAHNYAGKVFVESALHGATVSVQRLSDNTQTCSVISDNGAVVVSSDCIAQPDYYLLSASGGIRTVDGVATPFLGEMRAVMHSSDIARLAWAISPLSEIALRAAQSGDGSGTRAFLQARDEIADWLIVSEHNAESGFDRHDAHDLVQWPAEAIPAGLDGDAQQWHDAIVALGNGTIDNNMVRALTTPVTNVLTYDNAITDVATSENAIFTAHEFTIDITDRRATPWSRHTLSDGASALHVDGDRLIALDVPTSSLNIYSVADPANASRVTSMAIPGFTTQSLIAPVCLSDNMLYQITAQLSQSGSFSFAGKITVWRIDAAAVTQVTELTIEVPSPSIVNNWDLSCTDTTLSASLGYRLDLFHLSNNALLHSTIYADIYDATLRGDSLYVHLGQNDGYQLHRYLIASDGMAILDRAITLPAQPDGYPTMSSRDSIFANDSTVGVIARESFIFFNAQSLQTLTTIPITVNAGGAHASTDALWIWGNGNALWQVDMPD